MQSDMIRWVAGLPTDETTFIQTAFGAFSEGKATYDISAYTA